MYNMRTISPAVSEKKSFEIVDDNGRTDRRQTDAGAWVYYKLTYEPSAIYRKFFSPVKIENFIRKIFDILTIFTQNIDCGYSLETPQRGGVLDKK